MTPEDRAAQAILACDAETSHEANPSYLACEVCIASEIRAAIRETWQEAEKLVPTSWLDPMLTGDRAVLPGKGPWGCQDVERLLRQLAAAIRAKAEANRG